MTPDPFPLASFLVATPAGDLNLTGCVAIRALSEGRLLAVEPLLFGQARLCIGRPEMMVLDSPWGGWDDQWEFPTVLAAVVEMAQWEQDGESAAKPDGESGWTPLFHSASWPDALPVSPDVYRGICRVIVQIERLHSMQAVASSRLAVQVAAHLGEDAAAEWIAAAEGWYLAALRTGIAPEEQEGMQTRLAPYTKTAPEARRSVSGAVLPSGRAWKLGFTWNPGFSRSPGCGRRTLLARSRTRRRSAGGTNSRHERPARYGR